MTSHEPRTPAPRWTVLGAPLDSSGSGRGERRAPAALRAAGLVGAVGAADAGDATAVLLDRTRDPRSGLVGFPGLVDASHAIRDSLLPLLATESLPLVIGGDCSILLGVVAAVRRHHDRIGLWFLDGHADFWSGETSPTGEAADVELSILTGAGPAGLVDLAAPPLVAARDVVVLGHRRGDSDPDVATELAFLPPEMFHLDATAIGELGPGVVGRRTEHRLARQAGRVWLHLDLDVLDAAALPAVTYPSAGGLGWEDLAALMRPLVDSPALLGVSVADFNADLDPDGRYARQTVALLADLLAR
jgi:arginase